MKNLLRFKGKKDNVSRQLIKGLKNFTNNENINFVIRSDNRVYDLTPVFSAFFVLFEDDKYKDDLYSCINYGITRQLERYVGEDVVENCVGNKGVDDIATLLNMSLNSLGDILRDEFVESIKYSCLVNGFLNEGYKLYKDINTHFNAIKLSLCFRKNMAYDDLPLGLIIKGLYYLSTANSLLRSGKSIDEVVSKIGFKLSCEEGKKFLYLLVCSYIMLCKKYKNKEGVYYPDSFKAVLSSYGDYTEFMGFLGDSYKASRNKNNGDSEKVADVVKGGNSDLGEEPGDGSEEDNSEYSDTYFIYRMILRDVIMRGQSIFSSRLVLMYKNKMKLQDESNFNCVKGYKSDIRKLTKTNSKLKESILQKDKLLKDLERKTRDIKTITENNSMREKIQDLDLQLSSANSDNRALQNKLAGALNRIKTLEDRESSREELESIIDCQNVEIEKLESIIDDYERLENDMDTGNGMSGAGAGVSIEVIKEAVRGKKFLFVGGPAGFDKRLESVFSNFVYIDVNEKSSNFTVPDNIDCVVIMYRKVNHSLVYRLESLIKNQNIPIIRTGLTNLELLLKCIYLKLNK